MHYSFVVGLCCMFLSGCATMLYMRMDENGNPISIQKNLRSKQSFIKDLNLTYKKVSYEEAHGGEGLVSWAEFIFWELSPFGIISPLFGYPHKQIDSLEGSIILKCPVEAGNSMSIEGAAISGMEEGNMVLKWWGYFSRGKYRNKTNIKDISKQALKEYGRAFKISPSEIEINIECDIKECKAEVNPPEIAESGELVFLATELKDKRRIAEIRTTEEARKREESERNLKIRKFRQEAWESLNRSGLLWQIRSHWTSYYRSVGWGNTGCVNVKVDKSGILPLNCVF